MCSLLLRHHNDVSGFTMSQVFSSDPAIARIPILHPRETTCTLMTPEETSPNPKMMDSFCELRPVLTIRRRTRSTDAYEI